jgi:excisionase family DNA binding protein
LPQRARHFSRMRIRAVLSCLESNPMQISTSSNRFERRHPDKADRRRYARLAEAAEYLGCTDRTIRQMIADGRIRGYRSGTRLVRVDLNEVDAAMKPFGGAA